jgi:DNA invertase Pin-like site-specific DNA recombinase
MRKYVTYIRVSTAEQGRSGLGLEAQQRDIEIFLHNYSEVPWEILGGFSDVGSGADNERPELGKAIALARTTGAELLIAKLDRLSRKVSYLSSLMDDPKLRIRVASMPAADKFQLHIYAALAEQERDFISTRTKAALAAAKARGVKLGGDRGNLKQRNSAKAKKADEAAFKVMGAIGPMREQGMSLAAIADRFNGMGIEGGGWSATKVKRAIDRGVTKAKATRAA